MFRNSRGIRFGGIWAGTILLKQTESLESCSVPEPSDKFLFLMISRLSADRQLPAFPGDPGWGGLSSQPSQIVKYEKLGANNLYRLKGTNISSHMSLTSFSLQPRLALVSR